MIFLISDWMTSNAFMTSAFKIYCHICKKFRVWTTWKLKQFSQQLWSTRSSRNSSVISGKNIYLEDQSEGAKRVLRCTKVFAHLSECVQVYDQANKRIWWMPRQLEAMKDVVICDKLGEADKQALYPEISEWGNPALWVITYWIHRYVKRTRWTEPSK